MSIRTLLSMTRLTSLRLPIDWTIFGWPASPSLGGITLVTGDPAWGWDPSAPAFPTDVHQPPDGDDVADFTIDHVVYLVPELEVAVATLGRAGLAPRLRMPVGGRPAAFFRAGPVLEVIETPVREGSLYGIALSTSESLEAIAISWKALGLSVGTIKPAIQKGRRIMTVHDLDAGFAVMSADGAMAADG